MTRPTKRWVEARVQTWVERLGFGHWGVGVDWDTPANEGCDAQVQRSDYERATLRLAVAWRDWDRCYLDAVLCHEVMHIATYGMSRAHDFLLAAVEDNTVAHNIAVAAWKHAEEQAVDRMACALVAAFADT